MTAEDVCISPDGDHARRYLNLPDPAMSQSQKMGSGNSPSPQRRIMSRTARRVPLVQRTCAVNDVDRTSGSCAMAITSTETGQKM